MRKLLSIIFILSYLATKAQPGKEAWHWYFGQDCMIDFSSGQAVSGLGNLTNLEGTAALSDANTGQLIMYTNGMTVCNSSNHVMFNGVNLYANPSTTQAALIVPKPGSTTLFYVISVDENGRSSNHGVSYSIADISYNNGQGKIILANQPLTPPPTCEKVTAVRHCNGIDYWIITHSYKSDAFNVYLVTSAGINTTPVISHTGSFIKDTSAVYPSETGYLKASPNGKKLVSAVGYDWGGYVELFDFDNTTGTVSNPIKIEHTNLDGFYGASFSPDNSKVYVTGVDSSIICRIYQYDVSSNTAANIIASEYIVVDSITLGSNYSGSFDALQMAPDGKIYVARYMLDTLSVINNPNTYGIGCNFKLKGLALAPNTISQFGLPNFIDANYVTGINLNLPDVQPCSSFPNTLNAGVGFTSYQWNTGDTTNSIVANAPGKYWFTAINQQGCLAYDTITVHPVKNASTFVMPNIVTPNGDNINDEIDFSKYQFSSLQLEIYNRWGLKVFESNDPSCIWKPSANDVDGTYFANLQYIIECGTSTQNKNINKFITLVR